MFRCEGGNRGQWPIANSQKPMSKSKAIKDDKNVSLQTSILKHCDFENAKKIDRNHDKDIETVKRIFKEHKIIK